MKLQFSKALVAWAAAASAMLLSGCGALPAKPTVASDLTGGLLVVRLVDRLETPQAVQVDVSLLRDGPTTSVSGRRHQSVPGRYADYLITLPLPPQRYVLSGIRESGEATNQPGALLASMTVPFAVIASGPVYLGRLVVAASGSDAAAPVDAEDHYDEDTLLFRSAVVPLRKVTIERDVIAKASLASAVSGEQSKTPGGVGLRSLTVEAIGANADADFGRPARDAFAKFLRLKPPRAFAIGDTDARAFAYGSGAGAVERALRDCARAASARACRLFAVDDSLMATASCEASRTSASLPQDARAGCAAARPASP